MTDCSPTKLLIPETGFRKPIWRRFAMSLLRKPSNDGSRGIRDEDQVLRAKDVRVEKTTHQNAWLRVTLTGGANRQVRRMGKATGHPVVKLIRLSIGNLDLGSLKPGESRDLTSKEIKELRNFQVQEINRPVKSLQTGFKTRIMNSRGKRKRPDYRRNTPGETRQHAAKKTTKNRRSQ